MTGQAAPRHRNVGRVLGHVAVAVVILAVMAAAFALSYGPVRDIARNAGVNSTLVRIYPGILDAVFLVCCGCALMLRHARWWTRLYAWLSVLVTGALIGAADVYHATGLRLPRRTLDGTVWALPWALVLLGFSLWISTLQHTKSSQAPQAPELDDQAARPAPRAAEVAVTGGGLAEVGLGQAAAAREPAKTGPVAGEETAEPAAADARDAGQAEDPVDAPDETQAEDVRQAADVPRAEEPDEAGEAVAVNEVTEADETAGNEVTIPTLEAPAATAPEAMTPAAHSAPEADTPSYGFPVVTEQDVERELPRMTTPLGAPAPADVEDRGARGEPPTVSAERPETEAEPAHEDQPAQEPAPSAPGPPAENPAPRPRSETPVPFPRVRSTPTPPLKR